MLSQVVYISFGKPITGISSWGLFLTYLLLTCWLERRTRDRKVASSNPGRSGGRILFSRVNSVCWLGLFTRRTIIRRTIGTYSLSDYWLIGPVTLLEHWHVGLLKHHTRRFVTYYWHVELFVSYYYTWTIYHVGLVTRRTVYTPHYTTRVLLLTRRTIFVGLVTRRTILSDYWHVGLPYCTRRSTAGPGNREMTCRDPVRRLVNVFGSALSCSSLFFSGYFFNL